MTPHEFGEPTPLADLLDVAPAETVLIHDVWVGYNEASPLVARYTLRREPKGGLTGEAELSTGLMSVPKRLPAAMTAPKVRAFLAELGRAQLVRTRYEALMEHTDDSPLIEIVIQVPAQSISARGGFVIFHTRSQGDFHAPWAAFVDGRAYVVEGDVVGCVLASLDRPLRRAEHRRLAGFTPR